MTCYDRCMVITNMPIDLIDYDFDHEITNELERRRDRARCW